MYNVVSLDTTETDNSFVCDFKQNTLEIWTNVNANQSFTFHRSRCILRLREKCVFKVSIVVDDPPSPSDSSIEWRRCSRLFCRRIEKVPFTHVDLKQHPLNYAHEYL